METVDIINRCIKGDEESFRLLIESYSGFAYSVAFRITNDEEESKDIVQECFITIWQKIRNYNPELNFSNWLYKIIVNRCYDYLRKKKRISLIYPDDSGWVIPDLFSTNNPEIELDNKELGKLIRRLTMQLSHKQKIVFSLSELEGLNHDDISEITGMNKASIKSNLNHARRKIGKVIEKYF